MNATVEIDKAGRIVVPKKMRDALHLQPGDTLVIECDGNSFTVGPQQAPRGLYRERGRLVYDSGRAVTTEDIFRSIDEAREAHADSIVNGLER